MLNTRSPLEAHRSEMELDLGIECITLEGIECAKRL